MRPTLRRPRPWLKVLTRFPRQRPGWLQHHQALPRVLPFRGVGNDLAEAGQVHGVDPVPRLEGGPASAALFEDRAVCAAPEPLAPGSGFPKSLGHRLPSLPNPGLTSRRRSLSRSIGNYYKFSCESLSKFPGRGSGAFGRGKQWEVGFPGEKGLVSLLGWRQRKPIGSLSLKEQWWKSRKSWKWMDNGWSIVCGRTWGLIDMRTGTGCI